MQTTRRDMLKVTLGGIGTAGLISLGGTVPAFMSNFASAATRPGSAMANDNILVVVQLSGGNDGLNTVIPHSNDVYRKTRPQIAIKERLLKLNDDLSLNPGLTAFKHLFDDGHLAVINGCGYPNPNRSHFRSMEIWQTANPSDKYQPHGWLGPYVDHMRRGTSATATMSAVNIGSELPQALISDGAPVPSIQSIEDFRIRTDGTTPKESALREQLIRDLNAAH